MAKGKLFSNFFSALGNMAQPKAVKTATKSVVESGNSNIIKTTSKLGSSGTPKKTIRSLLDNPVIRGTAVTAGGASLIGGGALVTGVAVGKGVDAATTGLDNFLDTVNTTKEQRQQDVQNELDAAAVNVGNTQADLIERLIEIRGTDTVSDSAAAGLPASFGGISGLPQSSSESSNKGSGFGTLLVGAVLIGGGFFILKKTGIIKKRRGKK